MKRVLLLNHKKINVIYFSPNIINVFDIKITKECVCFFGLNIIKDSDKVRYSTTCWLLEDKVTFRLGRFVCFSRHVLCSSLI